MTEHIKWPDITSFHNVRKYAQSHTEILAGLGSIVKYRGKIKLDGRNAAVQVGNEIVYQSREQIITLENDNAGFARWADSNLSYWKSIKKAQNFVIFGEYCGKGIGKNVAINQIGKKIFTVFSIQVGVDLIVEPKEILDYLTDFGNVSLPENVYVLPWLTEEISLNLLDTSENLLLALEQVNNLVAEIEKEDPWVKENFGVSGVGEGVVMTCLSHLIPGYGRENFSNLAFKAKGEKHKTVKQAAPAIVNAEAQASVQAFADAAGSVLAALRNLEIVWTRADSASDAAEARLRRLMRKAEKLLLAPRPAWLAQALLRMRSDIAEDSDLPNAETLESADKLLRAFLSVEPQLPEPSVEVGPLGTVEIRWDHPSQLAWLVSSPMLPWPGVTVRSFSADSAAPGGLKAKVFRLASSVVEDGRLFLVHEDVHGEEPPRLLSISEVESPPQPE